jgi:formate dehydrogenase alpha subunit
MKITINGRQIDVAGRKTVLEVARENGIYIPSLCDHPSLVPFAGCRLCLVEIKGRRGFPPACSTVAEDGQDILTETPQLQRLRREILELILSEHPNACLICSEKENCEDYKSTIRKVGEVTGCVLCPNNRRCQLQEVVEAVKIDRISFPSSYRNFDIRRDDPFFDRNYNLCILCGRCVRVCHEVRGASAIAFVSRGSQAVIGTAFNRTLLESGCQLCGACVDVCPTGALTERATRGESLPDEKRDTICPLCGMGCELAVELRKGRIRSSAPKGGDTVNAGQACVKGRFIVRDVVHSPKRILSPMVRRDGELKPAGWDEALDFVAGKLKAYRGKETALVASSQLALEDVYVLQKFSERVLQTGMSVSTPAFSPLLGFAEELRRHGLEPELNFEMGDLAGARLVFLVGAAAAFRQPLLWLEILKAKGRGAKLITVNPQEAVSSRHASSCFEVEPGAESRLFNLLSRRIIENGPPEDFAGIDGHEDLEKSVKDLDPAVLRSAGIREEDLDRVSRLLSEEHPAFFLFGPAMAEGPGAADNIRALFNLSLLAGARLVPLAGESNERGVLEIWGRSPERGLAGPEITSGTREGRTKALYLAGPLPALSKGAVEFLVIQDSHESENTKAADAVFPAATFAEVEGTYINAEGRIQKFGRVIEPLGQARPDWWIVSQLALKMGSRIFSWKSVSEVSDELSKTLPALEEASSGPHKKAKPAFVLEEKNTSRRFLPFPDQPQPPHAPAPSPGAAGRDNFLDRYRSLNLIGEIKGLRKLRERQRLKREE